MKESYQLLLKKIREEGKAGEDDVVDDEDEGSDDDEEEEDDEKKEKQEKRKITSADYEVGESSGTKIRGAKRSLVFDVMTYSNCKKK